MYSENHTHKNWKESASVIAPQTSIYVSHMRSSDEQVTWRQILPFPEMLAVE